MAHPQLRLIKAPRGAGGQLAGYPSHAYAGEFHDLICEAATRGKSASIVSRHRFRSAFAESRWSVVPHADGRFAHTVRVTFPSWGKNARITAVLHDGTRLEVGKQRIATRHVAWFHVDGADGGYVIVPMSPSLPGLVRVLRPKPQRSAPHPGPTLVLELLAHRRLRRLTATFRYAPVKSAADADGVASMLRHAS